MWLRVLARPSLPFLPASIHSTTSERGIGAGPNHPTAGAVTESPDLRDPRAPECLAPYPSPGMFSCRNRRRRQVVSLNRPKS